MANQLDLLTVVKNKLADVREKTVQLADAQLALDTSRMQLVDAQEDLSEHIESLKTLASEITSELSFESFSEVKEDAVADSLKVTESAADETLTEDEEPAEDKDRRAGEPERCRLVLEEEVEQRRGDQDPQPDREERSHRREVAA
jgi:hypothetical protein